jgi:hypothetical protein
MTQRRRVRLSAVQRTDMWGRWKAGQSLHEIGRAFGKDHVSIQLMLAQNGGLFDCSGHPSPLVEHAIDLALSLLTADSGKPAAQNFGVLLVPNSFCTLELSGSSV